MDFLFHWSLPMWVYLLYILFIIVGMALLAKRVKRIREERDMALEAVGWLQFDMVETAHELSNMDWYVEELKDKIENLETQIKHLSEETEQGGEEEQNEPEEIAIRVHVAVHSVFDGYDRLETDGYEDTLPTPLPEWVDGLEEEIKEL